jgi:hypothetical protein
MTLKRQDLCAIVWENSFPKLEEKITINSRNRRLMLKIAIMKYGIEFPYTSKKVYVVY